MTSWTISHTSHLATTFLKSFLTIKVSDLSLGYLERPKGLEFDFADLQLRTMHIFFANEILSLYKNTT